MRINILGAPGCGTTSLGVALAKELQIPNFDADQYSWRKTEPPFQVRFTHGERKARLHQAVQEHDRWILSGSICRWGDFLIPQFSLVIFMWTPTPVRLDRLHERQNAQFGPKEIAPGGALHERHRDFMIWAGSYDCPGFPGRNRGQHEAWLRRIQCPILRLSGPAPIQQSADYVLGYLETSSYPPP